MPKIDKVKKKKLLPVKPVTTRTKKKTLLLKKPRSVRSKENTLAYVSCLKDQIKKTEGVKITAICHYCKYNKGKVVAARAEEKQELLKNVIKSYDEFGHNLGHLLHATVVKKTDCKCG